MPVQFKNNSTAVKSAMNTAKKKALTAIGEAAVEVTVDYMNKRYDRRIYQTGDLQRDVNKRVREADDMVDIGVSLEYGIWVHEGTATMPARPFLRDAITENTDIWKEVAEEYIGNEMK